jgi:hypothetical protein
MADLNQQLHVLEQTLKGWSITRTTLWVVSE